MVHAFSAYRAASNPSETQADLTKILADTLKHTDRLAQEVRAMEREIAEFSAFYYGEIGTLFEELQRLRKHAATPTSEIVPPLAPKTESVPVLAQKIYRRLAKYSHPDVRAEKNVRADFFIELNDAYQQRDLHKLMLLEQEWQKNEMPATKLEAIRRIETWLDSAKAARDYLERRRETLVESPTYILRQKIFWAKLSGENLLDEIKRNMRMQIAELRSISV